MQKVFTKTGDHSKVPRQFRFKKVNSYAKTIFYFIFIIFTINFLPIDALLNENVPVDCANMHKTFQSLNLQNATQEEIIFSIEVIEASCTPRMPSNLVTGCGESTGFSNVNLANLTKTEMDQWISILEKCVEDTTEIIITRSEYRSLVEGSLFYSQLSIALAILSVVQPVLFLMIKKLKMKNKKPAR
jgi:hypothetical protein